MHIRQAQAQRRWRDCKVLQFKFARLLVPHISTIFLRELNYWCRELEWAPLLRPARHIALC